MSASVTLLTRREQILPERRCTLYGTAIWDDLGPQQRLELRGLETAHLAATQARLAVTLARMMAQGPDTRDHPPAARLGAALLGYELTSSYLGGPAAGYCPPLPAAAAAEQGAVCGKAHAELVRAAAKLPPAELLRQRIALAHAASVLTRSMISGEAYRRVVLDTGRATRAALANPYHQEAICTAGEKTMAFLDEAGLAGAPGTRWWRRSFLVR